MRLAGKVNGSKVEILIDSGASLSFVNPDVVQRLKLKTEDIKPLGVRVANGEKLECRSIARDVPLQLRGYEFENTLYVLPIMGVDVILGVPWLEDLGPVLSDYSTMTMTFNTKQGREVTLRGRTGNELDFGRGKTCVD